eukprot:CAMPEP_0202699530 /NCGR_PEP_ID=MMETSP1385-20130828/12766_1 /ASSEMBLY_ACC=CAM_ASM_000861 /TAXON_ID=933848 /ORGANISM="Elphidium margaritaceum" /LENGTH=744 /DNA_ID=CAMNT_0049356505 /DNA_START=20 /DNA_END=2254 /DNA_ORIENTATION=+
MSSPIFKPSNYPIAINVSVTNCVRSDNDYLFAIQLSSNVTTWNIQRTLSELHELDTTLRDTTELQCIKLPRSHALHDSNKIREKGAKIIEDYLWKLLHRAYIFIFVEKFIQLPLIMESKSTLLAQQLRTVLREGNILYATQSYASEKVKLTNVKCVLTYAYVMDGYTINEDAIDDEWNEGSSIHSDCEFRIDLVEIKRVKRYQKELRFEVELVDGQLFVFKCMTSQQFREWIDDLKHMIKAQDGFTPYLTRWEHGTSAKESNESLEEEKIVEHEHANGSGQMNMMDHNIEHALSTFTLSMHRAIPPMSELTEQQQQQHAYDGLYDYNERVDLDIESCIHSSSQETEMPVINRDDDDEFLEQEILGICSPKQQAEHQPRKESDKSDEKQSEFVRDEKDDEVESELHSVRSQSQSLSHSHSSRSQSQKKAATKSKSKAYYSIDDDTDLTTLKLQQQKLAKERRNSMIKQQKQRMLRNKRDRRFQPVQESYIAERSDLMEYNQLQRSREPPASLATREPMIALSEYSEVKEQLLAWQSKAHRWQDMANLHERNHESVEMKLQQKETKYKAKIKDQQNEILTLTKLLRKRELELENKIIELRQLESASNMTIQTLITYKETNELRRKNSYIDGTLWKFTGDGMNNIKFNKVPKLKYVMYVPTRRRLYYSDSTQDDADTKLINVTHITHKEAEHNGLMPQLPERYRNVWIKIVGQSRIVLFVAQTQQDCGRWYTTIKNSLQPQINDDFL